MAFGLSEILQWVDCTVLLFGIKSLHKFFSDGGQPKSDIHAMLINLLKVALQAGSPQINHGTCFIYALQLYPSK